MSNLVSGVTFSLSLTEDLEDRDIAESIIDVLLAAPKSIRPKKFGSFQADAKIGSAEELTDVLVNVSGPKVGARAGSLIMEVGKDCGFQVQWNKSNRPSFPFISGHLMFTAISKDASILDDFLGVVRRLVEVLSPVYGEVRSMAVKGWDAPLNLSLRLPDVPPISIYGDEYIAFFGQEKIEKAPFLKIEKVGECYWLVAHASVMEGVPDSMRANIRSYFGENSFMANGKWKYTEGDAPEFDLSNSLCD